MTYHTSFCCSLSCLRKYYVAFLFFTLVIFGALGCSSPLIRAGRIPDTSKLETSLIPQISTRADILKILGVPRSSGGAMLPNHDSPRDLWCYYYEEVSSKYNRRIILFVFLDGDFYDGYLWFSSLPGKVSGRE